MNYKVFSHIRDVKELWNSIYKGNRYMTCFQSYDWMEIVEKRFLGRRPLKYRGWKLAYIVMDDNLIAPMVINKRQKVIQMSGFDSSSDYLSFIYKAEIADRLEEYCIKFLKSSRGYSVRFERINQNNPLSSVLVSLAKKAGAEITEHTCVAIDTHNGEGTFLQNLSGSARGIYNKSVNRLKRDNHTVKSNFEFGIVDENLSNTISDLYLQHGENRNKKLNVEQHGLYKMLYKIANKIRKLVLPSTNIDVLTVYERKHPVWLAQLMIDDELAAFWEGNIANSGDTLSLYRTAINDKYSWYGPGTILMVDFIEHIRDRYQYFDLSRGGEDYKFRFGGKAHCNYSIVFNANHG